MELMKMLMNDESGQGLVEYALILGLIALVCVVALGAAGVKVNTIWEHIRDGLPTL